MVNPGEEEVYFVISGTVTFKISRRLAKPPLETQDGFWE